MGLYFLLADKDLARGVDWYDQAVKLAPADGALGRMRLYQIGRFHLHAGRRARAREYFRKAVRTRAAGYEEFLLSELSSLLEERQ
jgi:tetratricopeptide (TPR) repeat protein